MVSLTKSVSLVKKFDITELIVCWDCINLLANGGCDGCETCVFSDTREEESCQTVAARMQLIWGKDTPHIRPGGEDLGYSTTPCSGCGTSEHGDRFTAALVLPV